MTAAAETRKRSREDGDCEMPLSKRINNLHINNSNNYLNHQQPNVQHSQPERIHHEHVQIQHELVQIQQHEHVHIQQQIGLENYNSEFSYTPELNQDENPYYYNKNKLLYELHVERTRRAQ